MRTLITLIILFALYTCKKIDIDTSDVIPFLELSPKPVQADGTSIINAVVKISKDAEPSKRKIALETTSGVFATNSLKTITVDALFENGELVARTTIRSPITPGQVVVTARPEVRSPYSDFIIKDSVQASPSVAITISLSTSAFGVRTGFLSDVQITGVLKNQNNKNVSSGTNVIFEDIFQNGSPVGGRFRQVQSSSDENSKVSAFYSPGPVIPGTNIYIRATVAGTNIKDSVLLTVIP